ncbi:T6SS effector BTH_I2691 family protein [Burkholderia pyrrocinia]|uniref:T6SS effector BTH_I2691 family protein n=1 Tax=Burkholderia pyrrocinia TaxID=60550 RepID=UPI002AB25913|nr:T6SS effector BTH_I2691 family protein [Burkholderia pyrrocinia]
MATTEQECANCQKTGLAILPVRYTVLPNIVPARLPDGMSGKGVTDVSLTTHRYGLRTLRDGWLYLYYVQSARGPKRWEVYKVTEDGRLWRQSRPLPDQPSTHPACAKRAIAVPMDVIAIERPEKCTDRVYIAFSEHAWIEDTFKRYEANPVLLEQRMQWIEPSKWINGGNDPKKHAVVATRKNIDDVVEYMPGLDPKLLEPKDQPLTDKAGAYDPKLMGRESTRYPLHIRQASPQSTSEALVKLMNTIGSTGKGQSHPPMMLALWDGVGNVHELNDFRNDAGSMLSLYVKEQGTQIDAMLSIDAAEVAVRNGAVAFKSRMRSALRAGWEGMLNNPGAMDGIPSYAVVTPEQQAVSDRRIQEAGVISPEEAKTIGDAEWPKYEDKLKLRKLGDFRPWFKSVQDAVKAIQARRTPDVKAWLKAPTFIAALHDYHEENADDGRAFEKVIVQAINGLPSEDRGAAVVYDLVNNMDPTLPTSLVWRAFAYNQKHPKAEIKELLAQAIANKTTKADPASDIADKIGKLLEQLKNFVDFREKMTEVHEHQNPISVSEKYLKSVQGDGLVITMGNALFKWTGLGVLGDCAGTFMIRGALMLRVGISKADTIDLVRQAIKVEPDLRLKLQQEYRALRGQGVAAKDAFVRTIQSLAEHEGGQLYRAKWNAVKLTQEGKAVNLGVRIGGTLAVIELLSFGCALAKADKKGEGYAMLVAGGFSSMSACLQASTKLMTGLAKDAARTLTNLKAITGYLGGTSALIGAVLDFGKIIEQAQQRKYSTATLYTVKFGLGAAIVVANFLTALTSSAPLIARITGGRSVVFLGKVGAGIAGATTRTTALAASDAGGWLAKQRAANAAGRVAVGVAAEEAGVVITGRVALLGIGRAVLFLAGWEVALAMVVLQLLIAYFSDNELQEWFEKCSFGKKSESPPWAIDKQHEEFEKALSALGLENGETLQ